LSNNIIFLFVENSQKNKIMMIKIFIIKRTFLTYQKFRYENHTQKEDISYMSINYNNKKLK